MFWEFQNWDTYTSRGFAKKKYTDTQSYTLLNSNRYREPVDAGRAECVYFRACVQVHRVEKSLFFTEIITSL